MERAHPLTCCRLSLLVLALCSVAVSSARAQAPRHPLDPLGWDELWTVRELLFEAGRADGSTRFLMVNLAEPEKSFVTAWTPGDDIPRAAFVVVRNGPTVSEATIDLIGRRVTSWEDVQGIMPPLREEEADSLEAIAKAHAEFQAALARRGFGEGSSYGCGAELVSYLGLPAQLEGRRLALLDCGQSMRRNRHFPEEARSIQGLGAIMDADRYELLHVLDERVAPMRAEADHEDAVESPREIPTPINLTQPLGPAFTVDGQLVRWQNWTFHFRVDPRVGLVVSGVRYRDGERERSILYRGSLGEIFVPYMDPSTPLFNYNWFDTEGAGFSDPLEPGVDCPDNAVYFDAIVASEGSGRPRTIPRSACLFETYAGEIAWRHRYDEERPLQTRGKRDLVLRSIALLGNYDYVFDWVFQQNGSINVRVGSTGVIEAKRVTEASATVSEGERPDAYGRFVSPNVVAVNHDHFFSYRLDLDVGGTRNRFTADRLVKRRLPDGSLRRSLWQIEPSTPGTETEARLRIDPERPALWRVVNADSTNHVGYPVGYQIAPRTVSTLPLADVEEHAWKRAAFANHHLWVTPYHPDELYSSGLYPGLERDELIGLAAWTAADRDIVDTDIVVWHTFGMHHVPRGEDWPVMPTVWGSFELRPFDFFDRNPALDLPRRY